MKLVTSSSQKGIALVTALFFGVICISLSVGLLLQIPNDLLGTSKQNQNIRASFIADAGIQDTMAWLGHSLSQGNEPCTISDPTPLRSGALGNWTWECTVVPDSGTPPNSSTDLRIYKLTSTAFLDGVPEYEITADVQGGQSFARFSMFIDDDDPSLWDFGISQYTRVRGPVHKNRAIRMLVANGHYSGPPPTQTPFDGIVSTSEPAHIWGTGDDPAANGNQYGHIFKNGQADLQYNVPERPLPGDSSILANAAFGSTAPTSPPTGVVVNAAGGVYIGGDADSVQMGLDASGNFQMTIVQGSDTTVVVEDLATGMRTVTSTGGPGYSVPGLGNGVVFASGSIHSLSGRNKGDHTIAVDFAAGSDIEITGSITRSDTVIGDEPSVTDDRLGLVAEHIYIASESVLPRDLSNPLYIYATILATERFEVRNAGSGSPGAMAIFGGLAGRTTWRVANIAGDSTTVSGYGGLSGYSTPDLHYDPLLANEPPPEYPTTSATELTVRSWREKVR